jgi:hypothetical protein
MAHIASVKGERVILIKAGAQKHQEHQGPHGRQLRWYPGRAFKRQVGKHGLQKIRQKER